MNTWLTFRSSKIPLSFRLDKRVPIVLGSLLIITLFVIIISLSQGETFIHPIEVSKIILGIKNNNVEDTFIIKTLRLPRILVAWLVGVGLAIAGTITQGITRNPLAAPSIIGVNAGAVFAAVTLLIFVPSFAMEILPIAAFLGGLIVSVLIYFVAWQNGSSPVRLILVGISFNLIITALINLMITFGEINSVSQALLWLIGSVYGRTWEHFMILFPWIIFSSVLAFLMASDLNTLQLGDDVAKGLGSTIEWQRGTLLLICVALAGASVATAGAVGFVGFMTPHLSRRLVGVSHQGLLPTAALMGGLMVMLADLLGRLLFAPIEIPCGVITAIIGAPYFIFLLISQR
ncbi:FecCD family ABC transporter permease [Crocosphaera chwakensis]|uniref:Iron(III) dicitrate transport system permease protein n=1 Tax=Crocosphaera chwakensis CCY0110 TaxID=391612 RepID=A3ISC7_9CHRO|nr:iron ABC transporter permease [Crocosphaera chwakensis]EAZ90643.1 iron(III) dicitrate transport system permease protein [Crocosphaera chwakensis CCY0110]